jgi:hypothetical protein
MRCIFCKQDSSHSRSVEHIMPESIGNKRRTLPPSVVCDKCNNYFARKVEQPLLGHHSMRNLRGWYRVPSKKGKSPSVVGWIGGTEVGIGLSVDSNGRLRVDPERERDRNTLDEVLGPGPSGNLQTSLLFKFEMDPPKREMSRFLAKMGLESVAEDFFPDPSAPDDLVYEPFFDDIRDFARYGNSHSEWPYSQRRVYPEKTLMRHPETNDWVQAGFGCRRFITKRRETLFVFCFYGIEFVINLGGPSIAGYQEWLSENKGISPMVEGIGLTLKTRQEAGKTVHYLEAAPKLRLKF